MLTAMSSVSVRTGHDVDSFRRAYLDHVRFSRAKDERDATPLDKLFAVSLAVRDRLSERWMATQRAYAEADPKRVYYFSLEYLMGRALGNNLINLGIFDVAREALAPEGLKLEDLLELENDAGLGNGGLGRLAACFLDSMATLGLPAMGYGIRYEFGIFEQHIEKGWQVEHPEEWLRFGNPWEIERPENMVRVRFGGFVQDTVDDRGNYRARWRGGNVVLGVPYDTPIAGYGCTHVNTLRLWRARASEEFDLQQFNEGDYEKAVFDKNASETISKVLYPNDSVSAGKELRLKQQYFFVACSLHDLVRRYLKQHRGFDDFPSKVALQLNDTHPSLAVPELMRILVDDHALGWERAWEITQATVGYTNHTLLPEALERWPLALMERLLPRHAQLIHEINRRFLRQVLNKYPREGDRLQRLSIVEDGHVPHVRMAHLAVVGAHSVNGVAELHTRLLARDVMPDFHQLWPNKFNNKTNGVTPRRWLLAANPALASLITERIGSGWITDLEQLRKLEPAAEDHAFRSQFLEIKQARKVALAAWVRKHTRVAIEPDSLYDVQIKRMHEYKRQLLNVLHVIALYHRIKHQGPQAALPSRTVIIGGKAAPGYVMAKLVIRLIHAVAEVVNEDPDTAGVLRLVFLPNYRVSLAEKIFPAADLSEQISTAGKEASGTGNMKFALNGALTIGTLDGANIEIRDAVGEDNFFLFGLDAEGVQASKRQGYRPAAVLEENAELRAVMELVSSGFFSPDERHLFKPIVDSLLGHDEYMLLADFASYCDAQHRAGQAFGDKDAWARMAVLNIARCGRFSSDRTIQLYADEIWHAKPVPVG